MNGSEHIYSLQGAREVKLGQNQQCNKIKTNIKVLSIGTCNYVTVKYVP